MKKIVLALVLLTPGIALAKDATATFSVKGWHCGGCSAKTESALKKVEGVKTVTADDEKNTVVIAYDDSKTNEKALADAIKKSGFEPSAKSAPAKKN
jgi:mercuric transport protein